MNSNVDISSFNDQVQIIDYHITDAQASRDAGDAAMIQNRLHAASFYYKRVYMSLAEFLPTRSEIAPWIVHPLAPINRDHVHIVDLVKHHRPRLLKSFTGGSQASNVNRNHSRFFSTGSRYALHIDGSVDTESDASQKPNASDSFSTIKCLRQKKVYRLFTFTMSNLLLVNLKLGRYLEGVTLATFLLQHTAFHQDNTKILLRRAQCFLKLRDCVAVERDLSALELQGFKHPIIATLREEIGQLSMLPSECPMDNVAKYVSSASPLLC